MRALSCAIFSWDIPYSLEINFGTKICFGPSRDHQMEFIVLVRDLGLPLKKKIRIDGFLLIFRSLNPNLHRKNFLAQGWFRNGP